jgi:hypothetical protein
MRCSFRRENTGALRTGRRRGRAGQRRRRAVVRERRRSIAGERLCDTFETNVFGVVEVCPVFVPDMARRHYGGASSTRYSKRDPTVPCGHSRPACAGSDSDRRRESGWHRQLASRNFQVPSGYLTRKAAVPPARFERPSTICRMMSISSKLVRRPNETPNGAGSNKEADDAGYGVRESH